MTYPFSSFLLNGRTISLREVQEDLVQGVTSFESDTLQFIRAWLSKQDIFELTTSGSTGPPKTIRATRGQMQASARRTLSALGISTGGTAVVCLSTAFIAGKMMVVRALENNMNLVAIEPQSDPFALLPVDCIPSIMAVVPLQLQTMLITPHSRERLNQCGVLLVGGAPLPEGVKEEVAQLKTRVYATYGMTETLSNIALQQLTGPEQDDAFHALPGIHVSADERGCLVVTLPEMNAAVVTNDLVELHSATSFRWIGRWDNVINSGGYKVMPEHVEQALAKAMVQIGISYTLFVAGFPHERLGQQVTAVIEAQPLSEDQERRIIQHLGTVLKPHEIPQTFRYLNPFRYTSSLKIDRAATQKLLVHSVDAL
jgi:O-succinylbenzoic acid--CoA ligase